MKTMNLSWCLVALLGMLIFVGSCSSDSPTAPNPKPIPEPSNLPVIPQPSSLTELMPAISNEVVIGMSGEIDSFEPLVTKLAKMHDDGSLTWSNESRHLALACPGVLSLCSSSDTVTNPTYISERPRLLHTRHWRRIEQNSLSVGTSYTFSETIAWGTSTTNTHSTEFSKTIGIETTVGGSWGPFSASVTASYEQTTTTTEIHSVTFSTEETEERTYEVVAPESGTRVYVLWQLVDEFSLVDVDTIPISESPTMVQVEISPIARIQFPSKGVTVMQTTDFP